ncbi:MAG: phycocyanin subunit beta, partial [Vulcanococcus sp.]
MFDAFTKVVAQADARGEFLNAGQIDALAAMVSESNKRMDAVNRITSNASAIVTNAARALFDEQPALIAPGGNAYTHRRMAACLRDMEIVLRYVTYAVFTGDASVLEDRCLNGL